MKNGQPGAQMPESVLIVQPGFLGDAVLATGMLRAFAHLSPQTRLGMVVRAEFVPLFDGHVSRVRVHAFEKGKRGGLKKLTEELKECRYDTALIPHRSLRSVWAAFRAGIPRRVGFRQSAAPWMMTDRVEYNIAAHELDRNAALMEQLGFTIPDEHRASWLVASPALVPEMTRRFGPLPPVVIAPGSVWATKQWTVDGFAGVARGLAAEGIRVLLAGSAREQARCGEIAVRGGLGADSVLAGTLSLAELVALFSVCRRVITNDSAPLHIAESLGVPVTAIFGPTVPEFGFGPRIAGSHVLQVTGLPCRPCGIHGALICPVGTHECMKRISAEEVLQSLG